MPPKKAKDFTLTKAFDASATSVLLELEVNSKLKVNGPILTSYLRNALIGGGISMGQVLQVSIYGQLEQFTIVSIDAPVDVQLEGINLNRPTLYLVTPT